MTKKIVLSGDIRKSHRPLIKDPQYVDSADYVVMESTYGNRLHDTPPDYAVVLQRSSMRHLQEAEIWSIPWHFQLAGHRRCSTLSGV